MLHFFFNPLVPIKFDILADSLNEPFMVTTPVGDAAIAKRLYRKCHLMFPIISTRVELVKHDMVDFDVILGIDWLPDCFASIDCRTRVVKFNFLNDLVLEWKR